MRENDKFKATLFTVVILLFITFWYTSSTRAGVEWDLGVWSVCAGALLLSVARFFVRHSIPLPEVALLSFPFLFGFYFSYVCSPQRVASMDQFLWSFDSNFGYPQIWLNKLFKAAPAVGWACRLAWSGLSCLFVVLYLWLPGRIRNRYLATLALTAFLILPMYILCPGAGPKYLFADQYPEPAARLSHPQPVFLPSGTLLNTTPSGHVTWALVLLWYARRYCRKIIAGFFAAVLIATAAATLGLGEHYVIDLVLALPYAAAIRAVVERYWWKAGVLLAIIASWLVALRLGWALLLQPLWACSLCVVSVAAILPAYTWRWRTQPVAYRFGLMNQAQSPSGK